MSKHTDTGRAGTRRGGKKLWILIPVIAVLIIAAALVWLNSVYVYAGGLHRRDSAQIDLRGKSISEERYLRLREQLPDCKIYWDVPIGGAVIGGPAFQLSGIGLGILAGILLNLILPAPKAQGPGLVAHGVSDDGVIENPDEAHLLEE